jgi:hypothetical protein
MNVELLLHYHRANEVATFCVAFTFENATREGRRQSSSEYRGLGYSFHNVRCDAAVRLGACAVCSIFKSWRFKARTCRTGHSISRSPVDHHSSRSFVEEVLCILRNCSYGRHR